MTNNTQQPAARVSVPVHIIGAGLLGASIGLGLSAKGVCVTLADVSAQTLALAVDYGAGGLLSRNLAAAEPQLVIVATPPDQAAGAIIQALADFPQAVVTDVTSVKLELLTQLQAAGADLRRYVGSHPMAGREKGGVMMARADLFVGRPWVICRNESTPASALSLVEALALELGAVPVEWDAAAHDSAVAAVSHLPQVASSLLAARLLDVQADFLGLAGGGLRDTTRIAASDPLLWVQILLANRQPVAQLLQVYAGDVQAFAAALENPDAPGARTAIAQLLHAGNQGVSRIPGKHGSAAQFAKLNIIVADRPGQLAALFTDLDELQINTEDMRLEHSPGAQIGFIEISVVPEVLDRASQQLRARGWRVV